MRKKIIFSCFILVFLLFISFAIKYISNNNVVSTNMNTSLSSLDSFKDGVILYYDNNTPEIVNDTIKQMSHELNVNLLSLNVNKDRNLINQYIKNNSDLINEYNKIRKLELDLINVRTSEKNKEKEVYFYYTKALNLMKEGAHSNDTELKKLKGTILDLSTIDESKLNELLNMQREPRIKIPLYSKFDNDAENSPLLKFVYDGNVRRSISLNEEIGKDELLSKDELKTYLIQEWFDNYSDSNDGKILKEKLINKEKFILVVVGNSCPHCKKLIPILNKYNDNYNIVKINNYNVENSTVFDNLVKSNKYGIEPIRWYPTILAFNRGKQIAELNIKDIDIFDSTKDLSYIIDENKLNQFLEKFAKY